MGGGIPAIMKLEDDDEVVVVVVDDDDIIDIPPIIGMPGIPIMGGCIIPIPPIIGGIPGIAGGMPMPGAPGVAAGGIMGA